MAAFLRFRLREPLLPLAALVVHGAISSGYLAVPDTRLAWGLISVGAGFAMLIVSLAVAYRVRRVGDSAPPAASPTT